MSRATDDGDEGHPDPEHVRPPGVSDATVEALGVLSEALEIAERARGHLYAFHQMTGGADLAVGTAVELLRRAGHTAQADLVEREIVGRNVIPGHWTYQIVEAYNATYYRPFTRVEAQVRQELASGRAHLYEAEMKEARRARGCSARADGPEPTSDGSGSEDRVEGRAEGREEGRGR
ncbi:hypothetical protein QIS99_03170 [Streptomyces sp. B-S-A8]|uniref:Uncharacterized protein n=1 Tax=Streptomyces solicavernae TaxID=3043614 RepID=A0ABT6RN84_9ACTN|nr:hypothetical protein [Streptomyces sp. B-S-A8]MDI3385223.1 hypothetical protein [Streptomyces sp. B-S-A8]